MMDNKDYDFAAALQDDLRRQQRVKEAVSHVPGFDSMAVGSPGIAQTPPVVHNESMNDITRPELDAKLSATEERMNARVASIESKIDTFLAVQAERDKATEYRIQRIEADTASIKSDVKEISNHVQNIRVTMARYMGGAIVIGAIASAAVGALVRFMLTNPPA